MEIPQAYTDLSEAIEPAESPTDRMSILHDFIFRDRSLETISVLTGPDGALSYQTEEIRVGTIKHVTKAQLSELQRATKENMQAILSGIMKA